VWGRGRPSWQHRRSEIASLLPRSPKFPRERGGRAKHSRLQSFYFQAFVAKERFESQEEEDTRGSWCPCLSPPFSLSLPFLLSTEVYKIFDLKEIKSQER
jgi:hypothetical protein